MSDLLADVRAYSERQFQAQVTELATLRNWVWYHTHDSRRSPAGFPDLVLVRGRRLVFAELKRERGRLTKEQEQWLRTLQATDAEVYVWRPSDWPQVQETLW